jgi:tetratricopeptide (TPR) repeat protein
MQQEWYQQGLDKANAQDFQGAIATFDQLLQTYPDCAEAYYQRGLAYFKLGNVEGNIERAIADYTQAIELNFQSFSVYYARGLAYLLTNALEESVADAKQALLLQPTYAPGYDLLGKIRQQQGNSRKAIASYKRAAELYLDEQDIANCRRCLDTIRKLQPALPTTPTPAPTVAYGSLTTEDFLQQAVSKAKQGKYQEAMDDLDWVVQIDPQEAQGYVCRAQVHTQLGTLEDAIADYQQAAKLYIDQADKAMAQQMIEAIQSLKTQVSRQARLPRSPRQPISTGNPSRAVQQKLLKLVGSDRKIIAGLVERLKIRNPGMPEDWYWEKAMYELERDRR